MPKMRENIVKEERRNKRVRTELVILAVLVVIAVYGSLLRPAMSYEKVPCCGKEEHIHTEECYRSVPTCGIDHVHTIKCYTKELVCGKEEHRHTDACYEEDQLRLSVEIKENYCFVGEPLKLSIQAKGGTAPYQLKVLAVQNEEEKTIHNGTYTTETITVMPWKLGSMELKVTLIDASGAKVTQEKTILCPEHAKENKEQWDAEITKLNLKGTSFIEDLLTIAKSQIGYKESAIDYIIDEENNQKNYSRFGDWYGAPYEEWNLAFTAYCLHYANAPEGVVPVKQDVATWIKELKSQNIYRAANDVTPVEGNLLFYTKDEKELVGVITKIEPNGDNSLTITSIEGDYDGEVRENQYNSKDQAIQGYAIFEAKQESAVALEETEQVEEAILPMSGEVEAAEQAIQPMSEEAEAAEQAIQPMSEEAEPVVQAVEPKAALPGTIMTEDTKSQGIILNLFDYDGAGTNLDSDSNMLNKTVVSGINATSSGAKRDFLFFGYGSEVGKNSTGPTINHYSGGNIAIQGIVSPVLSNGYPTLNIKKKTSLSYLFNPTEAANGKTTYTNVNHLFTKDADGYYTYDSNINYAQYDKATSNFIVYNKTYLNSTNTPIGFFPFNAYNEANKYTGPRTNSRDEQYDHHFGLTLETTFSLPESGMINGKDMIFNFSGDDDVWVFIDDVLVLDIGGIHGSVTGNINFKSGEVTVTDAINATGIENKSTNGKKNQISDIFSKAGKTYDNSTWSMHTIKLFYLERGGNYSNNTITFNLPLLNKDKIQIGKEVTGTTGTIDSNKEYAFQLFLETKAGSNQYEVYKGEDAYYEDGNKVSFDENGTFKLKANQEIEVLNIEKDRKYYVKELDVDGNIFSEVKTKTPNAVEVTGQTENQSNFSLSSSEQTAEARPSIVFENVVKEEYKNLTVKKKWSDGNDNHQEDMVTFQLKYAKDDSIVTYDGKTEFTLNKENDWQMTFENLCSKSAGEAVEYKVVEKAVTGYEASYSGGIVDGTMTILNTAKKESKVTVNKKWYNPDGTEKTINLPEKIGVELWRRHTPKEYKVNIAIKYKTPFGTYTSGKDGEIRVSYNGQVSFYVAYNYSNVMSSCNVSCPLAGSKVQSNGNGNYTVSNITSDTTVTVLFQTDSWFIGNTNFTLTDKTPSFDSSATEEKVSTKSLSAANNWTYTWGSSELDSQAADGNSYYYYVKEILPDSERGRYTTTYDHNDGIQIGTITIKNTCKYVEGVVLPEAGGRGTWIFKLCGMALLILACILYKWNKIQQRRCKSFAKLPTERETNKSDNK